MYATTAPLWRDRQVFTVPLFKQTQLSTVPRNQFQEAHLKHRYSKWVVKYANAPVGVVLNHHKAPLVAVTVSHDHVNLDKAVIQFVGETPFQVKTPTQSVFFYRQPEQEAHRATTRYLLDLQKRVGLSILTETKVLPIGESITLPPRELSRLPELTAAKALTLETNIIEAHNFSAVGQLPNQGFKNPAQFDIHMNTTLTHLAYELLLGSRTLLECCEELEAVYYAHKLTLKSDASQPADLNEYRDRLYTVLLSEIAKGRALLPPSYKDDMTKRDLKKLQPPFQQSHVQLDYEGVKKYAFHLLSTAIGNDAKVLSAVESVVSQIALSTTLTALEIDNLKRFLAKQSGLKLNITRLASEIQGAQRTLKRQDSFTNLTLCLLEFLNRETDYRHDKADFWRWNGAYWEKVDENVLFERVFRYFPCELVTKSPKTAQKEVISRLKEHLSTPLNNHKSASEVGVNFLNGYLKPDLTLVPHDKSLGLTYVLPVNYDTSSDDSPPEKLNHFLYQIWGHDDDYLPKVQALQEAMAVTLFGLGTAFQRAFLLFGVPNSGKTQLLNLITEVMPNVQRSAIPPEVWNRRKSLKPLSQALINVCGELSDHEKINGRRFKEVIDGTEISAGLHNTNHLNETLRPMAAHWFASNYLPKSDDTSLAFARRWLIFRFNQQIKSSEVKLDIGRKIAYREAAEILSWCVKALPRVLKRNNFTLTESHSKCAEILKGKNNSVANFFLSKRSVITEDLSRFKQLLPEEIKTFLNKKTSLRAIELYQHFIKTEQNTQVLKSIPFEEFLRRMEELASEQGFIVARVSRGSDEDILVFGVKIRTDLLGTF